VGLKRGSVQSGRTALPRSNRTIVGLKPEVREMLQAGRWKQQSHHCGIETLSLSLL